MVIFMYWLIVLPWTVRFAAGSCKVDVDGTVYLGWGSWSWL
jgi:hypothetical protein